MARIKVGTVNGGQFRVLPAPAHRTSEEDMRLQSVQERVKTQKLRQGVLIAQLTKIGTELFGGAVAGGLSRAAETSIEDQRAAAVDAARATAADTAATTIADQMDAQNNVEARGVLDNMSAATQVELSALARTAARLRPPEAPVQPETPQADPSQPVPPPRLGEGDSLGRTPLEFVQSEISRIQEASKKIAQLGARSQDPQLKARAADRVKELGSKIETLLFRRSELMPKGDQQTPGPMIAPAKGLSQMVAEIEGADPNPVAAAKALGIIQEKLRSSTDRGEVNRLSKLDTRLRVVMEKLQKTPSTLGTTQDTAQAPAENTGNKAALDNLRLNLPENPTAEDFQAVIARADASVERAAAQAEKDAKENILDWAGAAAMVKSDPTKLKQALAGLKRSGFVGVRAKNITELTSSAHIRRAQAQLVKLTPKVVSPDKLLKIRAQTRRAQAQTKAANALTSGRISEEGRRKALAKPALDFARDKALVKQREAVVALQKANNSAELELARKAKAVKDAEIAKSKATGEAEKARRAKDLVQAKLNRDTAAAKASNARANLANTRAATERALRDARKNKLVADTGRANRANKDDKKSDVELRDEARQIASSLSSTDTTIASLTAKKASIKPIIKASGTKRRLSKVDALARQKIVQKQIDKLQGLQTGRRDRLKEIRDAAKGRRRGGGGRKTPPTDAGGKGAPPTDAELDAVVDEVIKGGG